MHRARPPPQLDLPESCREFTPAHHLQVLVNQELQPPTIATYSLSPLKTTQLPVGISHSSPANIHSRRSAVNSRTFGLPRLHILHHRPPPTDSSSSSSHSKMFSSVFSTLLPSCPRSNNSPSWVVPRRYELTIPSLSASASS